METYYNLKEVAEMLGVKVRTVRKYITLGRLNSIKLPTNARAVSEEEVRRFLNERGQ